MSIDKIKGKIRIAKEATEDLEEELKVKGFEVILNHLLKERHMEPPSQRSEAAKKAEKVKETERYDLEDLITRLDAGKYSYIRNLKGIGMYLSILDIFEREFQIDALCPKDISDILSIKFGIKKSRDTIGVTLKNHLAVYVNRKGDGNPYWYSLTPKGKAFLESEIRVK